MEAKDESLGMVLVANSLCLQRRLPLVIDRVELVVAHVRLEAAGSRPLDCYWRPWLAPLRREDIRR